MKHNGDNSRIAGHHLGTWTVADSRTATRPALPAGRRSSAGGAVIAGNSSNEERWRHSTAYDDAVALLRRQFAAGPKYDAKGATSWRNLAPCYNAEHESPPGGWAAADNTLWLWTDGNISLSVHIFGPNSTSNPEVIVIDYQRWDHAYVCNRD